MSDKVYSCEICGKRYKNSKSLRTHKYSYHRQKVDSSRRKGISPHLAYTESDSVYTASDLGHQSSLETDSIFSESSDLQNRVLDMEIDAIQWRNDAPGAPATPGGAVLRGRQIVIKMWDNFARLTARLAKSRVLFNNSTIYLDFSAIFSQIVPNRLLNEGRPLGATFCRRGATSWLSLQRYATEWGGKQFTRTKIHEPIRRSWP